MDGKQRLIAASMALAMLWSVALVWLGFGRGAGFLGPVTPVVLAYLPGGLVMVALIGRLAQRRFFDPTIIDGQAFAPGSGAEIDQRVLTNTTEQMVLALVLWPFAGWTLGWGLMPILGVNFAVMRVLFWAGYHRSPPLRGFGFAASFYPTVVAALAGIVRLMGV